MVLERLGAVDWGDGIAAYDHGNSRALLMREYLRRAAAWARAYGAEDSWPFLDLAELVAPEVTIEPGVAAELEEALKGVAPSSLKRTCRAAVRWAALTSTEMDLPADLPADPYEPLLLLFERGGGYFVEEFVDLNGAMVRLGTVDSNLAAPHFLTLLPSALDALDAEGAWMSLADVEAVARAAHARQTDKAGRPYAEHLSAVAEGVRARGGPEELVAAAWLHDAVEDGVLSEEWLERAPLSRRTKDVVLAVTKRAGEEPEAYARRILATPGALLVKTADLAHNADPGRLAVLDEETARRLTRKYAVMRGLLGLAPGE